MSKSGICNGDIFTLVHKWDLSQAITHSSHKCLVPFYVLSFYCCLLLAVESYSINPTHACSYIQKYLPWQGQWNAWDDVEFQHREGKLCYKICEHQGQQRKSSIVSVGWQGCACSPALLRAHVWGLLQTKRVQHQQLKPMLCTFKTKYHLSWAGELLYHWMECFFSWVEHVYFVASFVNLQ